MDTQKTQIHNYLRSGKSLTGMDALTLFGCFRLAARIADLERDGVEIDHNPEKLPSGKRVTRYKLTRR
jgi:hypothetical protein